MRCRLFRLKDTIPIDPPKGTPPPPQGELLEDVKMSEAPAVPQAADVTMDEDDAPTPNHVAASPAVNGASSPAPLVPSSTVESLDASSPYSNVSPNDDDIQPPPAKRARKHSDADQASLANVRLFYFVRRHRRADPNVFCPPF